MDLRLRHTFAAYLAVAVTGAAPAPPLASAQVYKHVDEQGHVTYTNAPVDPAFELEAGATPGPQAKANGDGGEALLKAARRGDPSAVSKLLVSGVSANFANSQYRQSALHMAVNAMNSAAPTAKLLLDAGADPNAPQYDGATPLHLARDPAVAALLLGAGAKIEARDNFERTPLLVAVANNQTAMATFLVERGANIEAHTKGGDTALIDAALKQRADILRMLISHGARLDAQNDNGTTALHNAARGSSVEVVEILLEAGAPVNTYDKHRRTPLDSANSNYPEIAAALKKRSGFKAGGPKPPLSGSASTSRSVGSGSTSVPNGLEGGGGISEETVGYGYDKAGRLDRVERNGSVTTYQYDDRNNLVRRNRDGAVREYTVNSENQVIRMQEK